MENRIRFKIGEIEFEAEGEADIVERERNVFLNSILPAAVEAIVRTKEHNIQPQYITEQDTPLLEQINEGGVNNNDSYVTVENFSQDFSRTSLPDFLKRFGDVSDQDFAIMAVYYYEKKNGKTISFTSETIKLYYTESRRKQYSNYSSLLAELVKKGLIMDDPKAEKKTPKSYILTNSGINYVEAYRPKERSDKPKLSKTRKSKAKQISEYSTINIDDLNLSKYPDVKKLTHFKEQMIMIMYIISSEQKGEYFSTIDIQCLMTDIFGLHASDGQINGVFKNNKTWFKKEKDLNNDRVYKRKLLQGAKDFVQQIIQNNNNLDKTYYNTNK